LTFLADFANISSSMAINANIEEKFFKPERRRLMLDDLYIHERLWRMEQSAAGGKHQHMHAGEGSGSVGRRLARLLGRGLLTVAERLLAYGGERPLLRLTVPAPPVVELRPGSTPFSQN